MSELIKRLKNKGTLISIVSACVLILTVNGVKVDNERVMTTVNALCGIGILLGVLNNPTTPGMDNPIETKKEDK